MNALATLSKGDLLAKLQRAKGTIKNWKEGTEEVAIRAMNTSAALAGGAASGLLQGWDEEPMEIPGIEVNADAFIAGVAIAVGVTGIAGKASDAMCSFGGGMGAAAIAFKVKDSVRNRDK